MSSQPHRPTIRPIEPADEPRWRELFGSYREFYKLPASEDVVDRVWTWLNDPDHETHGQVAILATEVHGIAHYRSFARPSTGTTGLWLDDLFTDPDARGQGLGRALIDQLTDHAREHDLSVVRWITADDNGQARMLYDNLARPTNWVTYDATP